MAKFFLINNTRVGTTKLFAGSLIDDTFEDVAKIRASGGVLIAQANGPVAAAAVIAQKLRRKGYPEDALAQIMESALAFNGTRMPKGPNLATGDATIFWSDGLRRVLPAATLGANSVLTISPLAGADGRVPTAGVRLQITRIDATAFTYAIANGGGGGGTLKTLPISAIGYAEVEFDGTNWELVQ